MSELKYTVGQMNNIMSSSLEYFTNWKEAEKENKRLTARIADLEAENTALKQHPQPIEFWSDEKKELYRRNESRTIKSGREEESKR